jgi:hypothetical protein
VNKSDDQTGACLRFASELLPAPAVPSYCTYLTTRAPRTVNGLTNARVGWKHTRLGDLSLRGATRRSLLA